MDEMMDLYDDAILGVGRQEDMNPELDTQSDVEMYDDVPYVPHEVIPAPPRHSRHHHRTWDYPSTNHPPSNKDVNYHLYVGNLTWWTSESDIFTAIQALGVPDFVQVNFFENPVNGQSKGFCTVTVGSEESMRKIMEHLGEVELHGKKPVVTYPTRNNMNMFEAMNPFRYRVGRKFERHEKCERQEPHQQRHENQRQEKYERQERQERTERRDKYERQERQERKEQHDKYERQKYERHKRHEQHERHFR